MICPSCSLVNADDRRFCKACGSRLKYDCARCGFPNESDSFYCGGCGQKLAETVKDQAGASQKAEAMNPAAPKPAAHSPSALQISAADLSELLRSRKEVTRASGRGSKSGSVDQDDIDSIFKT